MRRFWDSSAKSHIWAASAINSSTRSKGIVSGSATGTRADCNAVLSPYSLFIRSPRSSGGISSRWYSSINLPICLSISLIRFSMSVFWFTGTDFGRLSMISFAICGDRRSSRIWLSICGSRSCAFQILFLQSGSFTMLFICFVLE